MKVLRGTAGLVLAALTALAQTAPAPEARIEKVTAVSVYVKDQDEALRWYTEVLGFEKCGDDRTMPGYRWLTVAPRGETDFQIVLLQAGPEEMGFVGKTGTAVLRTRDCRAMSKVLEGRGVKFVSPPRNTKWGVSAVFVDLYGNGYNLIEPHPGSPHSPPK
jgi:predicted enzyme related to lactoylglutathione lyase